MLEAQGKETKLREDALWNAKGIVTRMGGDA